MKSLVIIVLFFFQLIISAQEIGESQGKYQAEKDDSPALIKKQLIQDAFKNALNKKFKDLGFNSSLFWQEFDFKFAENWKNEERKIRAKESNVELIEKIVKEKKIDLESNFLGINQVIQSFSIKNTSRSASDPNIHYIVAIFQFNLEILNSFYYRITNQNQSLNSNKKLYIAIKLNLENSTWDKLSIESGEDIVSVIRNSYERWFKIEWTGLVDNIEFIDSGKSIGEYMGKEGYLFNVKYNLVPNKGVGATINSIEWTTQAVVYNLKSGSAVNTFTNSSQYLDFSPTEGFASSLIAALYSSPLSFLKDVRKELSTKVSGDQLIELKVVQFDGLTQLLEFREFLKSKGIALALNVELDKVESDAAYFKIFYKGEIKKVEELFTQLSGNSVNNAFKLGSFSASSTWTFQLVKI